MVWEKVRLGDVCDVYGGTTPSTSNPEYWNGEMVWLSPSDLPAIGEISHVKSSARKISNKAISDSSLTVLPKGSVIYSTRASIGKIAIAEVPLTTNQGFANFVCNGKVFNKYLAYALKFYTRHIANLGSSTTFAEVSRTSIKNFEIPLPSYATQEKIAAILDQAEALRIKDRLLLERYDELLETVFYQLFSQYVHGSKAIVPLSDFIDINPRKSEIKVGPETEVSFIPMSAVGENGELDASVSKSYKDVSKGFTYFREGDVLFAKITPCMENGKGAIASGLKNGIGFGSTEFHVLRPNDQLKSEFIYSLLHQKWVRKFAESSMTGSAGQKRVPTDFFRRLRIYKPPIELQEKYSSIYLNIMAMKENAKKSSQYSEGLFQSLLQKALNGELIK